MKRCTLYFWLGWVLCFGARAEDRCSIFLSSGWFRERSEVSTAQLRIERSYKKLDLENNRNFPVLQEFYAKTLAWAHSGIAMRAVEWVDANPQMTVRAIQLFRELEPVVEELDRFGAVLRGSRTRLAQKESARNALAHFDKIIEARRMCLEIQSWPERMPKIALTEGLARSHVALRAPAIYLSPGLAGEVMNERIELYKEIYYRRDEISALLHQLELAQWNVHFMARAWTATKDLHDLLSALMAPLPADDHSYDVRVYFEHEQRYFQLIRQETADIMHLLDRLQKDRSYFSPRIRESLDYEWEKAKVLAISTLNIAGKGPESMDPTAEQEAYLQSVSAITENMAKMMYPLELVEEAERRLAGSGMAFPSSFAFWTWCREAVSLTQVALNRIRVAENLGLYDGHGSDSAYPLSVEIGAAHVKADRLHERLVAQGCLQAE